MRILITGGAGFVGSRLALSFREQLESEIVVLDNLRRRGSESNLVSLRKRGVAFYHGDIRQREDLADLPGNFDLLIEASAETSVHAGQQGSPSYVIGANLLGSLNCLDFARQRVGAFLFLSTSRVYSISSLRAIRLRESKTRFDIAAVQSLPGVSPAGITEEFPTHDARSFYGATKLASELLTQEYSMSYGLRTLINRCGVIAGPGQFGRTDQGVFTCWVAYHHFGVPLQYTGFGGSGKQVRDLLHPSDLAELIRMQVDQSGPWEAEIFNVGGGQANSTSLLEMTALCREVVGSGVQISATTESPTYDVPLYVSDCTKARERFGWEPRRDVRTIVIETAKWIRENENTLKPFLCDADSQEK